MEDVEYTIGFKQCLAFADRWTNGGGELCLTKENLKSWDQKLCQAEFAHNHAMSRSTRFNLFQVVYSIVPHGSLDLILLLSRTRVHGKAEEFVGGFQEIHKQVHDNLVQAAAKYKSSADKKRRLVEFQVGDYDWVVLTKDPFSIGDYNKLSTKTIGPVEIVEKINPNAYQLKLPSHIRTTDVFNVKHLIPYVGDSSSGDDDAANLRANFLHPGGNDAER